MQLTKDQRQAAIDALMDLIHGRNDLGGDGMPPLQGDATINIDPRLNKPQSLTGDMSDMNINDPDDVLGKMQPTFIDNQMPQKQQSGDGNGNSQQQKGSKQDQGQSGDNDQQGGDQGDQGNGGQNDNSQGQNGNGQSDQQGQGDQQNGQSGSGSGDGNDQQQGSQSGQSENGNSQQQNGQNQQDQKSKGNGSCSSKQAGDYVDAWNDIMTRFDRDEIEKAELIDLMNRIKSGEISY